MPAARHVLKCPLFRRCTVVQQPTAKAKTMQRPMQRCQHQTVVCYAQTLITTDYYFYRPNTTEKIAVWLR